MTDHGFLHKAYGTCKCDSALLQFGRVSTMYMYVHRGFLQRRQTCRCTNTAVVYNGGLKVFLIGWICTDNAQGKLVYIDLQLGNTACIGLIHLSTSDESSWCWECTGVPGVLVCKALSALWKIWGI